MVDEAKGVSVAIGRRLVLEVRPFVARPGSLVGPSGCGKITLHCLRLAFSESWMHLDR